MLHKLPSILDELVKGKKVSANTIASALNISRAAVYKKIDGSSQFTFDEVLRVQKIIGFNLDDILVEPTTNKITFNIKEFNKQETPEDTLRQYITQLSQDLSSIAAAGTAHVYYAAKDLPLFCFFSSPVLTSFKLYFWYLTLFDSDSKSFTYSNQWLPQDILDTAAQLYNGYLHIHSTEIWNQETINSTLHQIEYCISTGLMQNSEAAIILQELHTFIETLENNAALETKKGNSVFKLYYNEVLLLDNTVLFEVGAHKMFYLPLQTLNFLSNTNPTFTTKMYNWIHKQIKKSTLISGEAEKERNRCMGHYKKMITALVNKVSA